MKALKLKSSTKENPVWGETEWNGYHNRYSDIGVASYPSLFEDNITFEYIKSCSSWRNSHLVDQWELVNIKITIEQ